MNGPLKRFLCPRPVNEILPSTDRYKRFFCETNHWQSSSVHRTLKGFISQRPARDSSVNDSLKRLFSQRSVGKDSFVNGPSTKDSSVNRPLMTILLCTARYKNCCQLPVKNILSPACLKCTRMFLTFSLRPTVLLTLQFLPSYFRACLFGVQRAFVIIVGQQQCACSATCGAHAWYAKNNGALKSEIETRHPDHLSLSLSLNHCVLCFFFTFFYSCSIFHNSD